MKTSIYLIFNQRGGCNARKFCPDLEPGQVAIQLVVSIPDSAFMPRIPSVAIDISEDQLIQPAFEPELSIELPEGGVST